MHQILLHLAGLGLAMLACALAQTARAQDEAMHWTLDVRERAEWVDNAAWTPGTNANPSDNRWVWFQRLQADSVLPLTDTAAMTVSLVSAVRSDGPGGPVDTNVMDFNEAYLAFGHDNLWLRAGRQNLRYGSQRLIGTRDGTNVRRSFDGVRARLALNEIWAIEGFAAALVDIDATGIFNDGRDEGEVLAGAYATGKMGPTQADLYYIYTARDDRATIEGTADQKRHSVGARAFSAPNRDGLNWNWEAVIQFGSHGGSDVLAGTLATNTGFRWGDRAWSPEVMLSANIASGDGNPGDGHLSTFDALYPRGSYFSEAAILGPANFVNFNPWFRLRPTERIQAFVNVNWFRRLQAEDGVYGPPGNLLRAPSGSLSKHVTTQLSAGFAYALTDSVSFEALYTFAEAGPFIEESGPSGNVNFIQITLQSSF